MDTTSDAGRPTGRELLADALNHTDLVRSRQLTWRALGAAEKQVVAAVTRTVLPTLACTRRRDPDLDRDVAFDLFAALQRALSNSPHTLRAIAKGTPSPVHGTERAELCAAVTRKLTTGGYLVEQAAIRPLTYALVGILAGALDEPANVPAEHPRLPAITTGPVLDHDLYDWRTGAPKDHPDRATPAVA